MLQKVVIEHFRSCENVTIDNIGPSLVLVGPNGSGKTNILKAILWAARAALDLDPVDLLWDRLPRAVSLDFLLGKDTYRYSISIPNPVRSLDRRIAPAILLDEAISVSDGGDEWKELARRSGPDLTMDGHPALSIGPSTPFLPFLMAYLSPDDPLTERMKRVGEFFERVRCYPLNEPGESPEPPGWISQREYEGWLNRSRDFDQPGDFILMKLLHMSLTAEEDFHEVRDILRSLELIAEISIQRTESKGNGAGPNSPWIIYSIGFHPYTGDAEDAEISLRRFAFEDLSHGTRRIIRMVVSMIFDRGSVMLIEHPEDGIHRRLTASVFGTLRSYTDPSQIIVASHSPIVFDMLDPEEVRLVTMDNNKTEVHALPPEEIEQARRYIEGVGSLSEFLEVRHDL